MNANKVWNIVNAVIAIAVCYLLIFEDSEGKKLWIALGIFFCSIAAQKIFQKKQKSSR